jgi:hypothetical protein
MLIINKDTRIGWREIFTLDKVKKALRNEKRKEIMPMEEFRKSLLVVTNASTTDVKALDSSSSLQKSKGEKLEDGFLIIEEVFNKKDRSDVEKTLYKTKLIYTLIDIANRRIQNTIASEGS